MVSPDWVVAVTEVRRECPACPGCPGNLQCCLFSLPMLINTEMLDPDERRKLFSPIPAVPKQDAKRKCATQPLVKAILTLRGTALQREESTHFYIAESPLSAGLNPLLLVIESPNGEREFRSVLAVLPTWKIHTNPCESKLYRAALGCVRAKYRTLITALRPSNLGKTLPAEVVDGRHCGNSVPFWLARPFDWLIDEARQCDVSPRVIAEVSSLLTPRANNDPDVVAWNVLHLQSERPDSGVDPDWFIFEQWKVWEANGFGLRDCFADFSKKHKKPGNLKAFTTHIRYLGLPTPRKPGAKPRREKNWRMKQAVREKAD